MNEPFIVASRGRNPENPSDRTPGINLEQRLEPNCQGISNTLTSVQKDNYVVEPILFDRSGYVKTTDVANTLTANDPTRTLGNHNPIVGIVEPRIIEDFYKSRDERVYEDYSPSLRADRHGLKVESHLRIRKLTPKECFRLQGFDDESFEKAASVCSNTQLYKQAGNSITVDVLQFLFMNLKPYLGV